MSKTIYLILEQSSKVKLADDILWLNKAIDLMISGYIPLTDKLLSNLLQPKHVISLHYHSLEKLPNLLSIQKTKKSICCTDKISLRSLTNGVTLYGGCCSIIMGDLIYKSKYDVWSKIDYNGRRWIKHVDLFGKHNEIYINFLKKLIFPYFFFQFDGCKLLIDGITYPISDKTLNSLTSMLVNFCKDYRNKHKIVIMQTQKDSNKVKLLNVQVKGTNVLRHLFKLLYDFLSNTNTIQQILDWQKNNTVYSNHSLLIINNFKVFKTFMGSIQPGRVNYDYESVIKKYNIIEINLGNLYDDGDFEDVGFYEQIKQNIKYILRKFKYEFI